MYVWQECDPVYFKCVLKWLTYTILWKRNNCVANSFFCYCLCYLWVSAYLDFLSNEQMQVSEVDPLQPSGTKEN
jgi:hypothetical protein